MMNANHTRKFDLISPTLLETHETFIVQDKTTLRRSVVTLPNDGAATLSEQQLTLLVRGIAERVKLTDTLSVVLGRSDLKVGHKPDIDLGPYGATRRGVSRSHVRLHMADGHLYATDLGSQNGTFKSGERLAANQPCRLRSGDSLLLGALSVQVLFGVDEL